MLTENSKKEKNKLLRRIGANLKAIRKEKGIEVKQISAWLELSQQAYLNMENGKTDFSLTRIIELTQYLEVDINKLLDIECPGMFYKSEGNQMFSYNHSGNLKIADRDDSVTSLLQGQLIFLRQQCDHLAAMIGLQENAKPR
ncbi:MAG: helix-turn-helix transcriptional regulator [Bacteroidetes bacterium]|nr:helix-turn-helix transcriptional regulator [Bacteroidota bacterium]MBS1629339.1 helix-turn-helix transcriptional regulator [Bacteroidota bacterium]